MESIGSWNGFEAGGCLEDFSDLEKNIDVGDLLKMDAGEELQRHGNTEIRLEKYQQQLNGVSLFTVKPEDVIHSSLPAFTELIKELSKEHQDLCRDIRRKGRNKIHAVKCRQKSRDEVTMLQEKVDRAKERKKLLLEDNQKFQQNRDFYRDQLNKRIYVSIY